MTIFGSNDEGCCGGEDGDKKEDDDELEDEENDDEEGKEDDDKPTLPTLRPPTSEGQNLASIEKIFVLVAVGFKRVGEGINWKDVTADIELWKRNTLTVLDARSQPGLVQREPKKYKEWFKSQKQVWKDKRLDGTDDTDREWAEWVENKARDQYTALSIKP